MVRPDNRIIPARPGETILEAALREGIAFPYECRNGGCGQCKCTVLYGPVEQGPYQESALSAAERARGQGARVLRDAARRHRARIRAAGAAGRPPRRAMYAREGDRDAEGDATT